MRVGLRAKNCSGRLCASGCARRIDLARAAVTNGEDARDASPAAPARQGEGGHPAAGPVRRQYSVAVRPRPERTYANDTGTHTLRDTHTLRALREHRANTGAHRHRIGMCVPVFSAVFDGGSMPAAGLRILRGELAMAGDRASRKERHRDTHPPGRRHRGKPRHRDTHPPTPGHTPSGTHTHAPRAPRTPREHRGTPTPDRTTPGHTPSGTHTLRDTHTRSARSANTARTPGHTDTGLGCVSQCFRLFSMAGACPQLV